MTGIAINMRLEGGDTAVRQRITEGAIKVVSDDQPPRDEACPGCGRRVPIKLIRVYQLVDFDSSEAGKDSATSSENVVLMTRGYSRYLEPHLALSSRRSM